MQFIPTRIHAVADYLVGLILIASPWIFGFSHSGTATWLPVILGVGAFVYSLLTNYEGGILPLIPMPVHLVFDFLSGVLLAASPWLFGFSDRLWMPHLILGLIEIGAAVLTRTKPQHSARAA